MLRENLKVVRPASAMAIAPAMTNSEVVPLFVATRPASPVFGGVIEPVPVPVPVQVAGAGTAGAAGAGTVQL